MNNNKTLNLNTASYFFNILSYPHVLTWYTTGVSITKTIKNIGLTKHHQRKVEIMWIMFNIFKTMGVHYT